MYIYIENNIFINLKEIDLIMDYDIFIKEDCNKKILKKKRKKIIDLSIKEKGKRTIIFTKDFIYITSYVTRAIEMRAGEYERLVNSIVF